MNETGAARMKREPPTKDEQERASEAKANLERALASMARLRATIDNRPARLVSEQKKTAR